MKYYCNSSAKSNVFDIAKQDNVTNMEVLSRTGQRRLQDIVAERRLRMAGHIINKSNTVWTTSQSHHVMDPSW